MNSAFLPSWYTTQDELDPEPNRTLIEIPEQLRGVEHYIGVIRWWLPLALELRPVKVFPCG